ncbi:hypothetical protein FHG87_010211 [Trinorchestia longiramus]|nr:hypothetical protein FHG87_010211 [Trinorchestia longiramus]
MLSTETKATSPMSLRSSLPMLQVVTVDMQALLGVEVTVVVVDMQALLRVEVTVVAETLTCNKITIPTRSYSTEMWSKTFGLRTFETSSAALEIHNLFKHF